MRRKPKYLDKDRKYQHQLVESALRSLEEVDEREGQKRCETMSDWAHAFARAEKNGLRYSTGSQRKIMAGRIKPDDEPDQTAFDIIPVPEPSAWAKLRTFFDLRTWLP